MKQYLKHHPWQIVEEGFHPDFNEISESCFSIGNGHFGQRANFEENFSGTSLQGSYLAGIYYPDKTQVGWWKVGYPESYAKVVNAPNWIGIDVLVDGEVLDLATSRVKQFRRVLHLKEGYLERSFTVKLVSGKEVKVTATRFCSMHRKEVGAIRYAITPVNFDGVIKIKPYLDGDVVNRESNWGESFWQPISRLVKKRSGYLVTETKLTAFRVCLGMKFEIFQNGKKVELQTTLQQDEQYVGCMAELRARKGESIVVHKYVGVVTSRDHAKNKLMDRCGEVMQAAYRVGFDNLLAEQAQAWAAKWKEADVVIEGDVAAQQAIRFNIFQLCQTYSGEDERLNIGPKGFTGERYGGSTHWDTEAYCLPFFLATTDSKVARKLLLYRYHHLPKAIENAEKLGFADGAALYPMVTMNGEECHNEWEVTFGEIHRNGAIVYAIFDYVRYTGDRQYLVDFGLEVIVAIARFWSQRVHWSEPKQQYVIHGVTGPNEYENNVNNNWYTNYLAAWCLRYACEAMEEVRGLAPEQYSELAKKIRLKAEVETKQWLEISKKIFLPKNKELGIFLQQEGYLDKELVTVDVIQPSERPIHQHWSWDRILRSNFLKQGDVLLGLYFFENDFDEATIRRNFEFYEPRTLHESSLSPCVHAVLAAKLGLHEKAYEMFLRTARLDLDDYNQDTAEGLHVTSMAGAWLALAEGFGGMRAEKDLLSFSPYLPPGWEDYSFKIHWQGHSLQVKVSAKGASIKNLSGRELSVKLNGEVMRLPGPQGKQG